MGAEIENFDPLIKDLPKQYEVLGRIRAGGMGAVYKAQNRFTNQVYAIKVLNQDSANEQETRDRFVSEARAASGLKHKNICQVVDFGVTESETLYLVMEWIDGASLEEIVSKEGPFEEGRAKAILLQIGAALSCAHNNNIVHRDLKPDNIMLSIDKSTGSETVHLVDFGIAKAIKAEVENQATADGLTRHGMVVGTPAYMSPEQARAKTVDARSDVYGFGCVMYFVLAGRPPFIGDTPMDLLYQHVKEAPPPLDPKLEISSSANLIMLKCLEKAPADRYQSMEEVIADFKKLSRGVKVTVKPLAREREQKRNILLWWVQAIVVFGLVYGVSTWLQNISTPATVTPAPAAQQEPTAATVAAPDRAVTEKVQHPHHGKKTH